MSLTLLSVLTLLVGCTGEDPAPAPREPPRLGAPSPTPSATPSRPMDGLERSVAGRLASRLHREGLSLEYVDCPPWKGSSRSALRCRGYVDGVVVPVGVKLSRGASGNTEFDAWLGAGILATSRLTDRLQREGYSDVDCGSVAAYPARLGTRIVCRVTKDGNSRYLVATVTDRHGAVRIQDY
ncbi:MAG TPA: hypothetical protein VK204_00270 [Nocardioidaceae bacterium]|nr:hypothetical protein [Nocardioidaceae bacterium]